MSAPALLLQQVNPLCQLQDGGRFGAAELGLTQGGVVDLTSATLANALVGNVTAAGSLTNTSLLPVLEIGLGGLILQAKRRLELAFTGAAMPLQLNGKALARYRNFTVNDGDVLTIGYSRAGCRGYLAVHGGFTAQQVFGSVSTVLREQVGGINGLPLQPGMTLTSAVVATPAFVARSVPYLAQLKPSGLASIPWVAGAQADDFPPELLQQFSSRLYRLSTACDRMGVRLNGVALAVRSQTLLSEGIGLGAIQLPADGQPIVLLNDHQTIGGYPKLGAVTRLGVSMLGQCRPGDQVRFVVRTAAEARAEALAAASQLSRLCQQLQPGGDWPIWAADEDGLA